MGIELKWSPTVTGDSQNIYRSTSPFNVDTLPSVLASVGASVSEYTDATATVSGTTYYYAVAVVLGSRLKLSSVVSVTLSGASEPPVVIPPLGMTFVSSTFGHSVYSLSCDTGTANGNRKLLLVVTGQTLFAGGEVPYISSFAGQVVRNQSAYVGNVDHVIFGFVNIEGGGNKTLTVRSASGLPYRFLVTIYEMDGVDEENYAFESSIDTEAAQTIATYEDGAAVASGGSENASLASVGMSGLSTEDVAPVKMESNFWATTISEDGLSAGTKDFTLDCDGATSRAYTAAISMQRIDDPVNEVSLVYVGTTSEGDDTLSLDIATGAAAGDKTYLIGLGGQSNGIPYSHTFGGVSCEEMYSYKPSAYDFVQFLTCVVASGGTKTLSFSTTGLFYRKAMSVWEVQNWRRQDDFVTARQDETAFTMTPKDGHAIAAIALGRGSTAGAGIVGLSSDYGPAVTGSDFYYSASSDEYTIGAEQTINNDVNGTELTRDVILAIMLGPN